MKKCYLTKIIFKTKSRIFIIQKTPKMTLKFYGTIFFNFTLLTECD